MTTDRDYRRDPRGNLVLIGGKRYRRRRAGREYWKILPRGKKAQRAAKREKARGRKRHA